THIYGDVRDHKHLISVFQEYQPEFVFHLAAQPLVRLSYSEPRMTYGTNVMGTVNLFEAVRATNSVRVVVNITSDKCYENKEWVWGYRENDPMGGYDPYSSSKGCAELITAAYRCSFFGYSTPQPFNPSTTQHSVALASVRAGNVIGGGDWGSDRLVPDCVRALSKGEEIMIRYPKAIRPWQHVLEPLSGYLLLGAKLWADGSRYAGAWNFGPSGDEVWTVKELVKELIRLWGNGSFRVDSGEHLHEAHWLKLDCSKARIELDWRPRLSISQALEKTVEWYGQFYADASPKEMRDLSERQIMEYTHLIEQLND
ncbi:MAG: CDP-glucose 4,6-dehydratase, partial [Deltaproteobacteria bacterium]|nr:CDP-glucose 4,6-dehydratase [Deltaproteobacteria bacterium]